MLTRKRLLRLFGIALLIFVPAALLYHFLVVRPAQIAFEEKLYKASLKDIAGVFFNYHDANRKFPAPAILSQDGKPLLSWRVSILPFVGETALYKQFHLDEAWDSPHNKPLVKKMPRCYSAPFNRAAGEEMNPRGKTMFLAPVGAGTSFSEKDGLTDASMKDGMSDTIFLVLVEPGKAVEWTKPEDWPYDSSNPTAGLHLVNGNHLVANGHGATAALPKTFDGAKWRALFSHSGGEGPHWGEGLGAK